MMNTLKKERSPYLLQHAHQPVHWQAWSQEALEKARQEHKPILLSIGFSSCHWCHVMSKESFDDPEVAAYMNEHFINIKVDREERPDVDAYYMQACEAITGKGGWPLNVFLTPDREAYFAGTYFPPKPGLRQRSWMQALQLAAYNFYEQRQTVEREAEKVRTKMLSKEQKAPAGDRRSFFSWERVVAFVDTISRQFDRTYAGFGEGKKFPNTMALDFLIDYAWHISDIKVLRHVESSMGQFLKSGIRDHIGGGFFRYTVDRQWRIPHFEKMLYDNALLIQLFAKLQKWRPHSDYVEAIDETFNWIMSMLKCPDGGFYASLSADLNGQEGGLYTWTYEEVYQLLGQDALWFCEYFNITKEGNWENTNVLYANESIAQFATRKGVRISRMEEYIADCKQTLKQAFLKRPQVDVDEKINMAWNALLLSAFLDAYSATHRACYLEAAEELYNFIVRHAQEGEGRLKHLQQGSDQVFLEDYAYTISALIKYQTVLHDDNSLQLAQFLTKEALTLFEQKNTPLLSFSTADSLSTPYQWPLIKDEDAPNANAVMAMNMHKLGLLLGQPDWPEKARLMLLAIGKAFDEGKLAYLSWAKYWMADVQGIIEIAVLGKEAKERSMEINATHWGEYVLMASTVPNDDYPLLSQRYIEDDTLIYICKGNICKMPVHKLEEMYWQL
jgi:uncharacterized protein YyaL (SSP411 family)